MCVYNCANLLMVMALLAVCSGQVVCEEECNDPSAKYYELADIAGAVYTGTIEKSGQAFTEEYSSSCPDATTRRYRTFNGTCNHPSNLGSAFTPELSLLEPAYSDGVSSPRQFGVDGQRLPSAREVSSYIHVARDSYSNNPLMVMVWGQWVDHDIVSTAVTTGPNGTVRCCGTDGENLPPPLNPNCFPIKLPADDDTFPGKCLQFVRSLAATDKNGVQLEPRQQVNTVTSYLDGSLIYGATDEVAESVREPGSSLLRTTKGYYLPEAKNSSCIKRNETEDYCFHAGDLRVNQHPYLNGMHTIWLREHNRIARQFKLFKPNATEEYLFQQTRKLIVGMTQCITYNVYLPLILGEDARRWKIPSIYGRSTYDSRLDPRIFTGFAAGAFRFGHTTVPSNIPIGDKLIQMRYLFNRPEHVVYNMEGVLAGMTGVSKVNTQSIQAVDKYFVHDMSKYLFMNNATKRGLDLVSINIQRGRDQGLAPYVKWREFCGLRPVYGFNDTEALGPDAMKLAKVYRSVHDMDLYTGMVHEPVYTGLVGPTGRCLIGLQFYRLKHGDRFFFDNDEKYSRFSDAQLMALRRVTLSHVICHNSYIEQLPYDLFRSQSKSNPLVPCSQLRKDNINLALFA